MMPVRINQSKENELFHLFFSFYFESPGWLEMDKGKLNLGKYLRRKQITFLF